MMKYIILFVGCSFFLFSCKKEKFSLKKFNENDNNFVALKEQKYKNIYFKLDTNFQINPYNQLTTSSSGKSFLCNQLNCFFSVEVFREIDRNKYFMLGRAFSSKDMSKNFHQGMVELIESRMKYPNVAFSKELKTKYKNTAYIQSLRGFTNYYTEEKTCYCVASIKIKNETYVLQWIAPENIMSYTMDDFLTIVNSVRKIK